MIAETAETRASGAEPASTTDTRPGLLGAWVAAARPQTLSAGLAPVVAGTALAARDGWLHWGAAAAALGGALWIQIGTNLFNDWADFKKGADTEDRLGPPRAVQQGWLTPGTVLAGAILSFALAVLTGVYLVWLAGWPLVAIGLCSVACGVAYTGGPYPLAYVGLGDVFVLLFFGLVAVAGSWYVQAAGVIAAGVEAASRPLPTPAVWTVGLAIGLLATAILAVNNLRDRETDVLAAKKTFAVRFGPRATRIEHALCLLVPYALLALPLALSWPGGWGWLLPLVSLPLALREIALVASKDGRELNPHLGGAAMVQLAYAGLLALGVWPW